MQRMRAGKADALDALYLAKPYEQIAEVDFFVRARKARAVVIDVLAEQKSLFGAASCGSFGFAQDDLSRDRNFIASSLRHDAVGALFVAADHYVYEGFIWRARKISEGKLALVVVYVSADKFWRTYGLRNFRYVSGTEYEIYKRRALKNLSAQMACGATANADFGASFSSFIKCSDLAEELMYGLFAYGAGVYQDQIRDIYVVGNLVILLF